jgi:hypothetical protein
MREGTFGAGAGADLRFNFDPTAAGAFVVADLPR